MFILYNKNGHKFTSSKIYKIEEVLNAYLKFRQIHAPVYIDKFCFDARIPYLDFILKIKKSNLDLRCSICGCKSNHFRLDQGSLHLFGIKKLKDKNSAKYVFFNKDHILPASFNSIANSNLRLTCEDCNAFRGNSLKEVNIPSTVYEGEKEVLASKIRGYMRMVRRLIGSSRSAEKDIMFTKMIESILYQEQNIEILRKNYFKHD